MASDKTSKNAPTLFGTFGGVFTPAILTILGVIMFLRAGYVVGQAGVLSSLIILAVAEGIVLLTAISMSAIATNTPVKAGGAYYLISRTMGPQFGSAIGLALYLAQALSAPLHPGVRAKRSVCFPGACALLSGIVLSRRIVAVYCGVYRCKLGHSLSVCRHGYTRIINSGFPFWLGFQF